MDFRVEYLDGVFIGVTSGDAEEKKFDDLLDVMLAHPEWTPGTPFLHDHSDLDSSSFSADEIRYIAQVGVDRRAQVGAGKCAIVVARDLEYGLTRMWAAFTEGRWDTVSRVFRSRDEAMAWLSS